MFDCVRDLQSEGKYSLDQKLDIWDELELLVESLDNANDLENMKLWKPLIAFLSDPIDEMRLQSCWVLGTAIQNNPKSQSAFLAFDPLPKLLDLLRDEKNAELRSKAMYTVSGALRHHPEAVARFVALEGWNILNNALQDPSLAVRRKAAFLINSLFTNTTSESEAQDLAKAAQAACVQETLLASLRRDSAIPSGENGDVEDIDDDYSDKATQAVVTIVDRIGIANFSELQRREIQTLLQELKKENRIPSDIAGSEWQAFVRAVEA